MKATVSKLRIAGFKSFAEPVALDILPGLTGIVGPNGCGKSNVVEALRWAMGETSARSLRGGEMDDVIFAGTLARPSRNLAEVTVTVEGELPEPFAAEAELTLTRRIERGAGSAFRANGREVRARDVQTLYADLASGARSSGMVSQGRVAALVSAKPEERRQVLEEAAGITGLHARRHEAELKLRAAEQNLARAEDLRVQLEAGAESLRKQAKASARYRSISGLIRNAEADYLAILQGQAEANRRQAEADHAAAVAASTAASAAVEWATAGLSQAESAVLEPSTQEAASRSLLERRRIEGEGLAAEAGQASRALEEAERRLADVEADVSDARRRKAEADAFCARLSAESEAVADAIAALPAAVEAAERESADAAEAEREASHLADTAAAAATAASASLAAAEAALMGAAQAVEAARTRHEQCRRDYEALAERRIDPASLATAGDDAAAATDALRMARRALEEAELARAAATEAQAAADATARDQAADFDMASRRLAESQRAAAALAASVAELAAAVADAEAGRPPADVIERAAEDAETAAAQASQAERSLQAAEEAVGIAEQARNAAAMTVAEASAALARANTMLDEARKKAAGLAAEADAHSLALAQAEAARPDPALLHTAKAAEASAAEQLASCREILSGHQAARCEAEQALAAARSEASARRAEAQRLAAEAEGIQAALSGDTGGNTERAIDVLDVPQGLEAAVAAALGEAADHGLDPAAPRFWATLPDQAPAPLPEGFAPLLDKVGAPKALARTLSQAILVEAAEGEAIHPRLSPGQIAVSLQGDVWRWDGPVTRAGAPSPAAARLQQRNRLQIVTQLAAAARDEAGAADARVIEAEQTASACRAQEAEASTAFEAAQAQARAATAACAAAEAAATDAAVRYEALLPTSRRLAEACQAAESEVRQLQAAVAASPDPAHQAITLAECECRFEEARTALAAARNERQSRRTEALRLEDEARRIAAQAEAARQRSALVAPQLARRQQEHEQAQVAEDAATSLLGALPDPLLAATTAETAARALSAAREAAEAALQRRTAAEAAVETSREHLASLNAQHHRTETSLAALASLLAQAAAEEATATQTLEAAAQARRAIADPALLATEATQARALLGEARQGSMAAATRLQALTAQLAQNHARQSGLSDELTDWQTRLTEAAARVAALDSRAEGVRLEASAAAAAPADLQRRAEEGNQRLAEAEAGHAASAAALAQAEAALRSAASDLRQADATEAAARAALARAEGALEASAGALAAVASRVAERLAQHGDAVPALPAASDLSEAAEERARRRTERLTRERDDMGPVNLRADLELAELDERATTLERERDELTAAIAKLRGAIGHINREGRARLTAVFTEVDQHFRTLFTRTMGGGRAHLALTGSDDPLLAGLEIYAEPPGKKLSTLSLLSGGEQALTALSLIFAVFRCTPAPISVLDEVDAPLDDANVERFCTLLDDVVRDTGTRFLVVTHHQLTMSRMDRLFGVTMQERGVSRLLSVDLQSATAMVEETLQAAE